MCFGLKLQLDGGLDNLIFLIGFQMSKIKCFQIALNMCEMWFNGIKIAFFPKNYKKSPNSGGLRHQTPVCDTFELHWLSQHVSKVTYLHFWTILV